MYVPVKGDIVELDFNPSSGEEIRKRRPALVISTKKYSELTDLAFVCPITHADHNRLREMGLLIPVNNADVSGYINPLQCHTFDYRARHMEIIGRASPVVLAQVVHVINEIVNAKEI
ncbi:type II toxin-antitoxin system PemK/MazF family toxin [Fructilactobacillus carniphilus]|uniref:Type II toxin-antitoxin system PemK/MazF family toxin n=1 Tax=Fructilactobacillus carniphilus TaxID=2940297 RepID=A0ABY5BWG2_9LACO|nr:type II toxin-antitoxin system PemK/MazF family toxin [Fructilactobacillus carniphilus]USS90407.1 type II toxin-antitoxin system PemK/MazF family toxin [Fructilactobacillus carniphilus]